MNFYERATSTTWEVASLPHVPNAPVWFWFKPQNLPNGLAIQIPAETFVATANSPVLNLRNILTAANIDPAIVHNWFVYGVPEDAMGGMNPAFEQPIPPPPVGGDPNIYVIMHSIAQPVATAPVSAPPQINYATPVMPGSVIPGSDEQTLEDEGPVSELPEGTHPLVHSIDGDWKAVLYMEKQMAGIRKKLGMIQGRLNSLNRDLTPDERNHGDNQDRRDWQDARRWLRDASTTVSRYMRDHDIGPTSGAGKRTQMEELHKQVVLNRQPVPNLEEVHREFVNFRKQMQTLMNNMNNANATASRDGEQRAKRILSRIAAKVRKAKTKR